MVDTIRSTIDILRMESISGNKLSALIGSWTWFMLLRRPSLSLLRNVYKFINVSANKQFTIWNSVKKELTSLLHIVPLLCADLCKDFNSNIIASDASSIGGGVVTAKFNSFDNSVCGV